MVEGKVFEGKCQRSFYILEHTVHTPHPTHCFSVVFSLFFKTFYIRFTRYVALGRHLHQCSLFLFYIFQKTQKKTLRVCS